MTESSIPFKPCNKCGQSKPLTEFHRTKQSIDGYKATCKVCRCADQRDYVRRNPEKHRQSNHEWEVKNRDKVNQRSRSYALEHPEAVKASKRRSAEKHKEKRLARYRAPEMRQRKAEYDQRRYVVLAEKKKRQVREWNRLNPEKVLVLSRKKRAMKRNATGSHTVADIRLLLRSQKGLCWWCGKRLPAKYHVDHRIPLSRGGSNAPENLCISCPRCNMSKHDKLPSEWSGRLL